MTTALKKTLSALSDINVSKLTSSVTDTSTILKKIDTSAITSSITKSSDEVADVTSTVASKTDVASSLKKFDDFPTAPSTLKRATTFIAENPKLSAAGITAVSAGAYVSFLMSTGLSLDEALEQLGDLVEDTVETVAKTSSSVVFGGTSAVLSGLLKGVLGENYQIYLAIMAAIIMVIVGIKVRNLIKK